MHPSDSRYTKLRWLLTVSSLILYVVDIGTDVALALRYIRDQRLLRAALTLTFVLCGLVVTQFFSLAWYRDDMNNVLLNPEGEAAAWGMSTAGLVGLHLLGTGIFARYFHLLKSGYREVWCGNSEEAQREAHRLLGLETDLSMLKLFEAFLESVPQLLLQLYVRLEYDDGSVMQCMSMAFSFFNIAWSLVDYQRCLRRSLPSAREMRSGTPTVVYAAYKLCTITSLVLSYGVLLTLSEYTTVGLALVWLLGVVWANLLQTSFCSSRIQEALYRAVVGVILTFTFFNVKGQGTKVAMSVYYAFFSLVNAAAPLLLWLLRPETAAAAYFWPVTCAIVGGAALGLVCLVVYYALLHPRGQWREADELDGLGEEPETQVRIELFLMP